MGRYSNSKTIKYGVSDEESIHIDSLSDNSKFIICMKLYKIANTIDDLEKILPENILKKINEIY